MSCWDDFVEWITCSYRGHRRNDYDAVEMGESATHGIRRRRREQEDAPKGRKQGRAREKKIKVAAAEPSDWKISKRLQERLTLVQANFAHPRGLVRPAWLPSPVWIDELWPSIQRFLLASFAPENGQLLCFPSWMNVDTAVILYAAALAVFQPESNILVLSPHAVVQLPQDFSNVHHVSLQNQGYGDLIDLWLTRTQAKQDKRVIMITRFESTHWRECLRLLTGPLKLGTKIVVGCNDPWTYNWTTLSLLLKEMGVPTSAMNRNLFDPKRHKVPVQCTFTSNTLRRHMESSKYARISFESITMEHPPSELQYPLHYYWIKGQEPRGKRPYPILSKLPFRKNQILYVVDPESEKVLLESERFSQVMTLNCLPTDTDTQYERRVILTWGFQDASDLLRVLVRFPSPQIVIAWIPNEDVRREAIEQYEACVRLTESEPAFKSENWKKLPEIPLSTKIYGAGMDCDMEFEEEQESQPQPQPQEEDRKSDAKHEVRQKWDWKHRPEAKLGSDQPGLPQEAFLPQARPPAPPPPAFVPPGRALSVSSSESSGGSLDLAMDAPTYQARPAIRVPSAPEDASAAYASKLSLSLPISDLDPDAASRRDLLRRIADEDRNLSP